MFTRYFALFTAFVVAVVLLEVLPATAEPARPTGYEIMDRVYGRPEGDDRDGTITMTLTNHRGAKKIYTFKYYIKEYGKDKRSLITFLEPENLKGTGLLQYDYWDPSVEDERWLFLPALEKEKRITGESMNTSFLGSDFSYKEMGWRSTDEDTHTLIGEEQVADIPCWVVESVPVNGDSPYSKVVSWVNKENFVQVRNHFYDHGGELVKSLTTSDVKKTDGYWTVYKTRVENVQRKHETEYLLLQIHHDTGLADDIFDARNLKGYSIKLNPEEK